MHTSHFGAEAPKPGGCWTCTHFRGEVTGGGAHIVCRHDEEAPLVKAGPDEGCAFWLREPGADDEIQLHRERDLVDNVVFPVRRKRR